MRKLLLGSMIFCGLIAMAGFEDQVGPGITDNTQPIVPNRAPILVDTRAGVDAPAFAVVSTAFTDAILAGYQTAGADDFTVPDCGWEVSTIRAYGRYSNSINPGGPFGPATSLRVYILPKTGALPTTTNLGSIAVWFDEDITTYTELDPIDGGDFEVDLPNVVLPAGDYWLVVQANMELFAVGQWNWTESSLTPNSGTTLGDESAWYQSAAGTTSPITGLVECVGAWNSRVTGCSMSRNPDTNPPYDRDLAFQIEGNILPPGVNVSESSLITVEDGSAVTYDVVLDSPPDPGATVTVTPSSDDVTEGTVSGALSFDDTNWFTPQTVTITAGASGDGNDGDVAYTVSNAVASDSPGGCYDGVVAASVAVTNQNIEGIAAILVDPTSGVSVSEDGTTTATITISAAGTPTMDVSVDINDAAGLVTSDTATAVLTAGNGYSVDIVLTGVADDVVEDPAVFTIVTDAAVSGDLAYAGVDPNDVNGTLTDSNTAAVTVTPNQDPVQTTEAGGADTIDYVLTAEPTADVTFDLSVDDPNEATTAPTSLTFTAANWDTPQTVTVTGEDDDVDDGTEDYNVSATSTSSTDPFWIGVSVDSVAGQNADDGDTAGVAVTDGGGLVTDETGLVDTFTVELDTEPIFDVSLDFRSDDTTEGLVSSGGAPYGASTTLTFTPADWDTPQTVSVQGQDDDIRADGDIAYNIISENVVSGDALYGAFTDGQVADVTAVNNDDGLDIVGITVAPAALVMDEDSPPMTFTVRLDSQPTAGTVGVPLSSGDTTEATVSPSALVFTDANWATPQTVTVTPVLDFLIDGDETFDVTVGPASGGNYTGETATVSVTVNNIDDCGPMTLDVEIGESVIAFGSPTCVFDLYKTYGSDDPANWTYLGTFQVGAGGSVDTGVIGEPDCVYVTTVTGSFVLLTDRAYATVPTLGEWGMIAFISLLAMCGLVVSRRRRAIL